MGFGNTVAHQEIRLLAKQARKMADRVGFQFLDADDPEVTPLTLTNDTITPETWFQTPVEEASFAPDLPPKMQMRRTSSTPAIRLVRSSIAQSPISPMRSQANLTMSSAASSSSTLTVGSTSSQVSSTSFYSHLSHFNALDNSQVTRLMQYVTSAVDKQILNRLLHLNAEREAVFAQLVDASPKFFDRALRRGVPLEDTLKAYILSLEQGKADMVEYASSSSGGGMKMVNSLDNRKKLAKQALALCGV